MRIDILIALLVIALGLFSLIILNEYIERKRKKEKSA